MKNNKMKTNFLERLLGRLTPTAEFGVFTKRDGKNGSHYHHQVHNYNDHLLIPIGELRRVEQRNIELLDSYFSLRKSQGKEGLPVYAHSEVQLWQSDSFLGRTVQNSYRRETEIVDEPNSFNKTVERVKMNISP